MMKLSLPERVHVPQVAQSGGFQSEEHLTSTLMAPNSREQNALKKSLRVWPTLERHEDEELCYIFIHDATN